MCIQKSKKKNPSDLVLGTESLWLEDVVLAEDSLVSLVPNHQHRQLGGRKVPLHKDIFKKNEYL